MSKKLFAVLTCSLVMTAFVCTPTFADDDDKPKHTTKEVMKKAFKGPLVKKVAGGNASDAEKKELVAMLDSLSKNKPKKGDADSWKKLTSALTKAGKAVMDGEKDGTTMLRKAANCKACHSKHR